MQIWYIFWYHSVETPYFQVRKCLYTIKMYAFELVSREQAPSRNICHYGYCNRGIWLVFVTNSSSSLSELTSKSPWFDDSEQLNSTNSFQWHELGLSIEREELNYLFFPSLRSRNKEINSVISQKMYIIRNRKAVVFDWLVPK